MFLPGWIFSGSRRRKSAPTPRRRTARPCLEELEERVVPTLNGNQLFPLDNPWNQKITNAPVSANSAAIIQHIIDRAGVGTNPHFHPDFGNPVMDQALYGIPVNIVSAGQTPLNVIIDPTNGYPGESDQVPVPIPANAVIEGDAWNGPGSPTNRGDSHLIVYDQSANKVYELYFAVRPNELTWPSYDTNPGPPHTTGQWGAYGEAVWDLNNNTFRTLGFTSADAAGLPILPGLARPDEALPVSQGGQGIITHALRMTVNDTLDQYIFPGSHVASNKTATNLPRMGERFRLKASTVIPSTWPPEDQAIAQAMKDYGLIVADNGSDMYVSGEPSTQWDDNNLNFLKNLRASDFEVVDLTPIVTGISPNSGPTAGGTVVTITGQNFSGAAGNLHVFFGTTAATSFTINSDTQITATAPAGSGTVDVTVQSGSSKKDANSGKTVFWGYGTSAKVSADQFIYSNPTSPPAAPTNLSAASGNGQVTLTWTASSGATSYNIYRATTSGGEGSTPIVTGVTNASYTNTGLTNGTTYFFQVTAVNSAGESGKSNEASATPQLTIPSAPTNLNATAGNGQVSLTWTASSGAKSYNLYRATSSGGEGNTPLVTGLTGTSYTNTGLTNGTTYFYQLTAVNTAGESGKSNEASATPQVPAPPAPTGLSATAGNGQVSLTWTAATGATSYNIYRATSSGGEGNTPIVTGVTTTSYTNTGLTNGTTYYYQVTAVNAGGQSGKSNEAAAKPQSPGQLQFSASAYTVAEVAGTVTIKITRTGGSLGAVSVHYATSPGAAIPGKDYNSASGTLNFAAGQTSATFSIVILKDPTPDGSETINLTLSGPTGGATLGSPASAVLTIVEKPQVAFVLGQDSQIYEQKFDTAGNSASGYILTQPGQVRSFEVGSDASFDPLLFVLGMDYQVYEQVFDNTGNSVGGYALTQPAQVQSFTVGHDANNHPELFAFGLDHQVYAQKFDAFGHSISSYFLTAAGQVQSISVGNDASGNPLLFALGQDSQVYEVKFDAAGNPTTSYFLTQAGQVRSISVGHDANNHPELFTQGLDNQVYAQQFDAAGNSTSGYFLVAAGAVQSISVSNDASGNPLLFALAMDNQVYEVKFGSNGYPATEYFLTQAGAVRTLRQSHDASNHPELFVTGLDNQLYAQQFDAAGNSVSGYFLTQPGQIRTYRVTS
jgi:fibronectin type 3 domain-containing protein